MPGRAEGRGRASHGHEARPRRWRVSRSEAGALHRRGSAGLPAATMTPGIPWPAFWDLPGGGREGTESPVECVLRETHEEFGLHPIGRRSGVFSRGAGCAGGRERSVGSSPRIFRPPQQGKCASGREGQCWRMVKPAAYHRHLRRRSPSEGPSRRLPRMARAGARRADPRANRVPGARACGIRARLAARAVKRARISFAENGDSWHRGAVNQSRRGERGSAAAEGATAPGKLSGKRTGTAATLRRAAREGAPKEQVAFPGVLPGGGETLRFETEGAWTPAERS